MIKNTKSLYSPFDDCPPEVKEFLNYMMTIKRRSPRTVDGYYIELRTFLRYMLYSQLDEPNIDDFTKMKIASVTLEDITSVRLSFVYSFLNFCDNELNNSASAISRKISALRSFYKYLSTKTTYLKEDPLKNLEAPKLKASLPKFLTLEETNRLLDAVYEKRDYRTICILTLFLNCGMRLSELVGIDINDIKEDNSLKILGKGNKERIIYVNSACISAIAGYLEDTKDIKRENNALFVSSKGKRLTGRRVEQIVNKVLDENGFAGRGLSPHKLRHTAATIMYRYGGSDIRIIKEILGHSDLSTTEIYTHVSNEQVQSALDTSPLADRHIDYVKKSEEAKENEENNEEED